MTMTYNLTDTIFNYSFYLCAWGWTLWENRVYKICCQCHDIFKSYPSTYCL